MRKTLIIAVGAATLSACGSAGNVYDQPLPSWDDRDAQLDIRDKLKPEDQQAWQGIVMRMMNPMAEPARSKTVGEAITKLKSGNGLHGRARYRRDRGENWASAKRQFRP